MQEQKEVKIIQHPPFTNHQPIIHLYTKIIIKKSHAKSQTLEFSEECGTEQDLVKTRVSVKYKTIDHQQINMKIQRKKQDSYYYSSSTTVQRTFIRGN